MFSFAEVAELADAYALGAYVFGCEGSTPSLGTIKKPGFESRLF